jgi:hypothetical protein
MFIHQRNELYLHTPYNILYIMCIYVLYIHKYNGSRDPCSRYILMLSNEVTIRK